MANSVGKARNNRTSGVSKPTPGVVSNNRNNQTDRREELANAYRQLGGTGNTDRMTIPTLEKNFTNLYEQNQANNSPVSVLSSSNPLTAIKNYRDSYNARQEASSLYNDIKNNQTERTLERTGQTEAARQNRNALVDQLSNSVVGRLTGIANFGSQQQNLTPEMQNAGITESDLRRYNDRQNNIEREETMRNLATSHPVLSTLGAVPSNLMESTDNNLKQLLNFVQGKPLEENRSNADIIRQTVGQNINIDSPEFLERLGLTDEKATNLGRLGYSGLNSIGDMAISGLAGGGGKIAAGLMGLEKSSETMNDAIRRGLTPEQILAEAGLSGISTALTERLPFERFSSGGHVLGSMLAEGLQEGSEDILDTIFDEIVTRVGGNKDKSALHSEYNEYINAGYSPEEALNAVASNYKQQLITDTALGAITGGLMGMGSNYVSGRNMITGKPRTTETKSDIPTVNAVEDIPENIPTVTEGRVNPTVQNSEQQNIPTVSETQTAQPEVKQNVPSLDSVIQRAESAVNTFLNGFNSNVLGIEEANDLRNELVSLGRQNPEAGQQINNLWQNVVNTIRGNQTQNVEQQTAQPEVSRRDLIQQGRDTRNLINRAEQYKAKLSSFGNKSFNSQIDNAITALRNGDPNAAENLNNLLAQIDERMNGETVGVSERALNQDMYDQMKDVTDGRVIHISPETLKAMDMSVTELNDKISTGTGRLRFKVSGGTPIDSVYQEMYDLAGGMLPEPRSMGESDMVDAIVKYMTDQKSGKNNIVNESSWNDVPLEETRSSAVVDLQNRADELIDNILNGNYKSREEVQKAWSDFDKMGADLIKKYPALDNDLYNVVLDAHNTYRNSQMDADVREAKTPQDIDKSLMKYNLQFLSDVDEEADTDAEDFGRVNTGREKVRQTYSNTESKNMTEQERTLHEQDRKFLYNENSEKESMEEATHRLLENGFLKERKRLFAKEGAFNNVDVDEMMKLHKHYSDLAEDLEAQGKDATKEWQTAADVFNKLGEKITDNATGLQALAKWSRNTPEGLMAQATTIIKQYENGVNRARGKFNLTTEVQKASKRAKQMDANFMRNFMKEAKNLFTGSWEDVKNVTDGQTIHITRDMLNALGYEKLNGLNNDVFTNTSNSIRFTTKSKEGSSIRDAYKQMQQKAPDLLADPTGMTDEQMVRTLVSFIESKGQTVNFDSQGARHTMAKLGAMVNEQIPPTIAEKATTLLMDNMLGNIRTLLTRNAGGNIGFNFVEDFVRSPLTGFIDNLVSKKTGTRAVSGLSREGIDAGIEGFKEGLRQEIYDFKNNIQSARTGENNLQNAVANNRNNVFDMYWKGKKVHESKIFQKYNKLVKAGLSFGDRPFYEKTYKRSLAEYNKLYEQGLIRDKVTGEVIDRERFDAIADAYAKYNALQAVYQDDSTMAQAFVALKNGISKLSEGIVGADVLSQFSMPFVKTPANIIERSIEYSPLGFAKNLVTTLKEYYSLTDDFNQARFSTELSRNIIGTALFALGMYAAQAGALTGGYSDDKDMKQAQKEAGMQEYALHTGLGDFDISWLPVLGNNAVAAAKAFDEYNNSTEGGLTALSDGLTAGISSQLDTSTLQGLQRLVGGSGNSGYDADKTLIDNARNTLMTGLSQVVPSLFRQTAAFTDENQRQLSGPGENDYYRNNIFNAIPGLRQTLEPKIGRTGEELEQNPGQGTLGKFLSNFISPATWTRGVDDPVRDEAMRLFESTGSNGAFETTVQMKDLRTDDHEPTAAEFTEYQRNTYTAMNQIAQQMINSEYYNSATDGDKVSMLADIYSAIRSVESRNITGADKSNLSGAAKAYNIGGADALLEYVTCGNILSQMGMQNNEKNRQTILQTLNNGGADAVMQTLQQSQELEEAGLNENMQFKYDHAAKYIPSLSPTDFATQFQTIDQQPEGTTGHGSITQAELIDYLNHNPSHYNDDTALQLWNAYLQSYGKIPMLNPDTGLWEAKKP